MQYHKTDLSGYLNYGDFVGGDYEQEEPTQEDLDELIGADDGEKLFEFAQKWSPFTKVPLKQFSPDHAEELRAIYDTRELMLLVLNIKSLLDNGTCSCSTLRQIGFHIDETPTGNCEYGVVYLPSGPYLPKWVEEKKKASTNGPHDYFAEHRRQNTRFAENHIAEYSGSEIKQLGLHLPNQDDYIKSLDDAGRYKVFEFGIAVPAEHMEDPYNASWIMDDIMQVFLENVSTFVEGGIIGHSAGCNMVSFWLLVSERFMNSRVQICKACGLPVFASKERGAKRLYCNEACERKFRRAKKYWKLINKEGLSKADAAKKANIALPTAERIIQRNEQSFHPSNELQQ